MSRFNLSAWALAHRPLILFFIIASAVAGAYAYLSLGRAEDPSFTFKVMTIRTEWPGASAREVEQLVTDKIEKKIEELRYYDYARSYSRPGESVVFLNLKDSTPPGEVADQWYQARKKVGDIAGTLPSGVQGPYFNDEFGDVYSMIYAFTGADFTPAETKKIVEDARERLLRVPGVEKADLIAEQDQKIYVEISSRRLASFGIEVQSVIDAVRHHNDVTPAGQVDTDADRIFLRVDAGLDSAAAVRAIPIAVDGRQLTVGDVAEVRRGYEDPRSYTMRVDGHDAIGLGIVMVQGGNVLALDKNLATAVEQIRQGLPRGLEMSQVADQARVVDESIGDFTESLLEALGIVMAVSFLSLGWRSGIIVALTVPLVLGITFACMLFLGIDLQRVSSGALIIALGLLVDDAIIAVEMMVVKIGEGWDRVKAGAFAYSSTAFPMLTGTLVTAAGFVPVGFARSSTAEYTNSIFWVVGIALVVSWIAAVLFTPYLGYHLLPERRGTHEAHSGAAYRLLRRAIETCLKARSVLRSPAMICSRLNWTVSYCADIIPPTPRRQDGTIQSSSVKGQMQTLPQVADEKEAKILAAAKESFLELGYADTSMDAVAQRARASKTTLYTRFPSKEALFAAVISAECSAYGMYFLPNEFADQPIDEALNTIARRFLDLVGSPQAARVEQIILAEAQRFPEIAQRYEQEGPELVAAAVTGYFADAAARGLLGAEDPRFVAEHFLTTLKGPCLNALMARQPFLTGEERERFITRTVALFLNGARAAKHG